MSRILFFLIFASMLAACSSPPVVRPTNGNQEPYYIRVKPITKAQVDHDSFRVRLAFEVYSPIALEQGMLVQEIKQVVTFERKDGRDVKEYLQLVEAFRLRLAGMTENGLYRYTLFEGQSDTHRMFELWVDDKSVTAVRVKREVFAYIGTVKGADFTERGFAMLPANESGNVRTNVSKNFNQNYQLSHEIRGKVKRSGDHFGVAYRLQYRVAKDNPDNPFFQLDRAWGRGVVDDALDHYWRGN
ncbi:MAG: hypothetical protein L3J82_05100 [Planctomycetes bacterium]|nr:hypothetical protein [Planctomycetota bacterium]